MGPTQPGMPVVVSAMDVLSGACAHNPMRAEVGGVASAITVLSSEAGGVGRDLRISSSACPVVADRRATPTRSNRSSPLIQASAVLTLSGRTVDRSLRVRDKGAGPRTGAKC